MASRARPRPRARADSGAGGRARRGPVRNVSATVVPAPARRVPELRRAGLGPESPPAPPHPRPAGHRAPAEAATRGARMSRPGGRGLKGAAPRSRPDLRSGRAAWAALEARLPRRPVPVIGGGAENAGRRRARPSRVKMVLPVAPASPSGDSGRVRRLVLRLRIWAMASGCALKVRGRL